MRVLVAGRNAKVLAKAAGALSNDLTTATATSKAAALALLDHGEFDLVVACEHLGDGSGLEVLSHVAVTTPNTLRIFAARPATLELLKGELGLFGLFRTLPYPINFRALWAAMHLARSCSANPADPTSAVRPPPSVRHVVLDETWDTGNGDIVVDDVPLQPAAIGLTVSAAMAEPPVLASAAPLTTTAVRASAVITASTTSKALAKAAASAARAKARAAVAATSAAKARNTAQAPIAVEAPSGGTSQGTSKSSGATPTHGAPRSAKVASTHTPLNPHGATAAAATSRAHASTSDLAASKSPGAASTVVAFRASPARRAAPPAAAARASAPRASARIPESDAFRRALARRVEGKHRQEPSVSHESLAQLARLSTARRSTHLPRTAVLGNRRTALFVGSGVFAAAAAVILTFFMLRTNNSMPGAPLPLVASMDQAAQQKLLPWASTATPPPVIDPSEPTFISAVDATRPEAAAPTDMQVNAEATSEQADVEPGHPGPPQPNPPPGPSEPPAYNANGMPLE